MLKITCCTAASTEDITKLCAIVSSLGVLTFSKKMMINLISANSQYCYIHQIIETVNLKDIHGITFALKSPKEILFFFKHLITLCKDITFPLITKFTSNRSLRYSSVNGIWNKHVPSPIN